MLKGYLYRIYPTKEQQEKLAAQFDASRFVYNWGLENKVKHYQQTGKSLNCIQLINKLTTLKEEHVWLKKVYSQALQMAVRNLDNAFTKFFREKKGFPKFKSKRNFTQSSQYPQGIKFRDGKIFIPKIGNIKIKKHRDFSGDIKTVTVKRVASGKFFVSVLVDDHKEPPKKTSFSEKTTVGVDVGIAHFATLSNGQKIEHPKELIKAEKELKACQRRVSRKVKGSANRNKARTKLAVQYEKIKAKRTDFLHKLSRKLIDENQAVAIETLNVVEMLKNKFLAKRIADSSWSNFFKFLDYKSKWYGKSIIEIGPYSPTSKMCNNCGHIYKGLSLKERTWECSECNEEHDRDINAAKNIKSLALTAQNLIVPRGTRELTPMEIV